MTLPVPDGHDDLVIGHILEARAARVGSHSGNIDGQVDRDHLQFVIEQLVGLAPNAHVERGPRDHDGEYQAAYQPAQ